MMEGKEFIQYWNSFPGIQNEAYCTTAFLRQRGKPHQQEQKLEDAPSLTAHESYPLLGMLDEDQQKAPQTDLENPSSLAGKSFDSEEESLHSSYSPLSTESEAG